MALSNFLEPLEELQQDEHEHEQEDPLQAIIEEHLPQYQVEEEEEEEEPLPRVPTNQEAI